MGREIKFRAWDGDRMVTEETGFFVEFDGDVWRNTFNNATGGDSLDLLHSIDLMQFTGLKDKNGVEIWEDDIVNIIFDDGVIRCRVHWDEFHAGFKALPEDYEKYGISQDMNASRPYEVIGNIHQHSELLEGEG